MNNVTLSAATHTKLRKALDGTGTQVATCMINRWTVKMNGVERYITIDISLRPSHCDQGRSQELELKG